MGELNIAPVMFSTWGTWTVSFRNMYCTLPWLPKTKTDLIYILPVSVKHTQSWRFRTYSWPIISQEWVCWIRKGELKYWAEPAV